MRRYGGIVRFRRRYRKGVVAVAPPVGPVLGSQVMRKGTLLLADRRVSEPLGASACDRLLSANALLALPASHVRCSLGR